MEEFGMQSYDWVFNYTQWSYAEIAFNVQTALQEQNLCLFIQRGLVEELASMVFLRREATHTLPQLIKARI